MTALPEFPRHGDDWYAARLAPPPAAGVLRVVIDTDTANEIDDQFALAWALLAPERLRIEGIYAAPFSFAHRRSALPLAPPDAPPFNPPEVGMERSYQEILRVFGQLRIAPAGRVLRGSAGYLPGPAQALHSEAVEHLIATARATPPGAPLYVLALGCVTNIASALLLAPDIVEHIVVVWTSGFPSHAPQVNASFNLEQDMAASRILLESGVPHVYLPGYHVGAQLRLSLAESDRHVRGQGAIGDFLHGLFTANPLWAILPVDTRQPYSWVIWDLVCVAWLLQPGWIASDLVATPLLGDDRRWQTGQGRHPMREAWGLDRDAIFNDLFARLARAAAASA